MPWACGNHSLPYLGTIHCGLPQTGKSERIGMYEGGRGGIQESKAQPMWPKYYLPLMSEPGQYVTPFRMFFANIT